MTRSRWTAVGVAALATVAATAASLPGSAAAATPLVTSVAAPSVTSVAASGPKWGACPALAAAKTPNTAKGVNGAGPAQCADITVPLSWAAPRGRTITLRLSRLPTLDRKHRVGVLLFNPGGPGVAGAETIAQAGRALLPTALQNRFDIIGFDPRGVGMSTAVTCGGPGLSGRVPVFPRSRAQYAAVRRQSAAYGASCVKNSLPGLVANVGTPSAARDMDAIRVALGEKKISYLGLSYGTFLGQTYARLFPKRVGTMVLDGAFDHAVGPKRFVDQEVSALSRVFGRFASWCSATASCALHGQNVTKVWDDLLARAARTPIPAPNAQHGATTVNDDTIRMVLPNLLLFGPTSSLMPSTWPTLGEGIARARAGDASLLADNSMVGEPQDAYAAIGCQDFPPRLRGYADAAARLRKARELAPHTGAASEAWLMTDLCASWPVPASDPWAPQKITGTPPILITSTRYDPSTPLVWAQGLHREIAGSRLLVADVAGHTAFFNSACARAAEADYLISGRLPESMTCGV
ncbi:alpha/beta hydrolase [Actinomadura harenae]|nr:alpha/beta hydrolase [Actinomadura harenae]